MPKIKVTETATKYDINVNLGEELYEFEKNLNEKFDPNKHYYIQYRKNQNNKIFALLGLPVEADEFLVSSKNVGVAKVNINEQKFEILKLSTVSKDFMTFYDEDKDEIFYRRLYLEILEGMFDSNDFSFYNDGSKNSDMKNKIRLKVHALDSNENSADDIKEIHAKLLRAGGDAAPIPTVKILKDKDELPRKFTIEPDTELLIDVSNLEFPYATIRFKAYVPGIKDWWLSMYPIFKKIN